MKDNTPLTPSRMAELQIKIKELLQKFEDLRGFL